MDFKSIAELDWVDLTSVSWQEKKRNCARDFDKQGGASAESLTRWPSTTQISNHWDSGGGAVFAPVTPMQWGWASAGWPDLGTAFERRLQ